MRRIRRPKEKSEVLDQLTDTDSGGIFRSEVDAMIFSASLGAWKGETSSFEDSKEPMVFELFAKRSEREALFYALGMHDSQDLQILSEDNSDDLITTFEEYANRGLEIIRSEIEQTGQKPEDVILNLLHEARDREDPETPDFTQIDLGF